MPNNLFNHLNPFIPGSTVRAGAANAKFDAIEAAFDQVDTDLNQYRIKLPSTFTGNVEIPPKTVENTLIWINESGDMDLYSKQAFDEAVQLAVDKAQEASGSAAEALASETAAANTYAALVADKILFDASYADFVGKYDDFSPKYDQFNDTDYPQFQTDYAQFQLDYGQFQTDLPLAQQAVTDAQAAQAAAETAESNAAGSASAASTSESEALGYRDEALTYKNQAEAAASIASGAPIHKGNWDASGGTLPTTPSTEDVIYVISVAGTLPVIGAVYEGDQLWYTQGGGAWFAVRPSTNFVEKSGSTMSGVLTFENNKSIKWKTAGGALKTVMAIWANKDDLTVGDASIQLGLNSVAAPRWWDGSTNRNLIHDGGSQVIGGTLQTTSTLTVPQIIVESTAGIIRLQETDNTNDWYMVADGNAFSVRKNNTGTYPIKIGDDNKLLTHDDEVIHSGGGQNITSSLAAFDSSPAYDQSTLAITTGSAVLGFGKDSSGRPAIVGFGTGTAYNLSLCPTNGAVYIRGNEAWHAGNLTPSDYVAWGVTGSGTVQTTGQIEAGSGSGSVALTANDGYGNANLTFNHRNGVPDTTGSSARIVVNSDSTTGVSMNFQMDSGTTSGVATSLPSQMTLSEGLLDVYGTVEANTFKEGGTALSSLYLGIDDQAADSVTLSGLYRDSEGNASTVAQRTTSGDLKARLFRSSYSNQTTISGGIAYRVNDSNDDFIRFCSDGAAIRSFIGALGSSDKAADSDKLDGYHYTSFARAGARTDSYMWVRRDGSTPLYITQQGAGSIVDFRQGAGDGTSKSVIDQNGNFTGNAASATKLATARTISLTGDVTGSVSFNGTSNVSISAAVVNDSHTHDTRYALASDVTTTGAYGKIPKIGGDGVLEIGKIIDFHATDNSDDYDWRIQSVGQTNNHLYFINDTGTTRFEFTDGGVFRADNDIVAYYSDERLKDVKGRVENGLAAVMSWDPIVYTANELATSLAGYDSERMEVGLKAQQVQATTPEAVHNAPFDWDSERGESISGENYLTLKYERLVPVLVAAIQELKAEVDLLRRGF